MTSDAFNRATERAGLKRGRCGLQAVRVLMQMVNGPLLQRVAGQGNIALGQLVKEALVRYRDGVGYEMTPQGEWWLVELRLAGLLPEDGKGSAS